MFKFPAPVETMLDRLVEGGVHDPVAARQFLSDLAHSSPRESWNVVLPVARFLLNLPELQGKLQVQTVRDFCLPRVGAVELLKTLRIEYDPEADHMVGMAYCIRDNILHADDTKEDSA